VSKADAGSWVREKKLIGAEENKTERYFFCSIFWRSRVGVSARKFLKICLKKDYDNLFQFTINHFILQSYKLSLKINLQQARMKRNIYFVLSVIYTLVTSV
jgi:hypothetical protein